MDLQAILGRQVLRRQCRPEALAYRSPILLAHQSQHFLPELQLMSAVRYAAGAAVFQSGGTFLLISPPQTLRLPVAHTHQPACIHQAQLLAAHPRQRLHPSQLFLAHLCPSQSDLLLEVLLGGHFYLEQKGTLSLWFNSAFLEAWQPLAWNQDQG